MVRESRIRMTTVNWTELSWWYDKRENIVLFYMNEWVARFLLVYLTIVRFSMKFNDKDKDMDEGKMSDSQCDVMWCVIDALTVITPSLIAFLFRITIPMGFRMNFFGMTVDQQQKGKLRRLCRYRIVCALLYLFNVNERKRDYLQHTNIHCANCFAW